LVSAATENRRNHDREAAMNLERRAFLLLVTLAAAGPAFGQQVAPVAGLANIGAQGAVSIPDFSGIWRHGSLPWFEPPESGPAPVTNRSRKNGVSNYDQLVGDTPPLVWPEEMVKVWPLVSETTLASVMSVPLIPSRQHELGARVVLDNIDPFNENPVSDPQAERPDFSHRSRTMPTTSDNCSSAVFTSPIRKYWIALAPRYCSGRDGRLLPTAVMERLNTASRCGILRHDQAPPIPTQ
jgi:hypothetical protein